MSTHTCSPDINEIDYFNKLLVAAENRICELRKSYETNGANCMETRIAIGYALVPLNILYEDAYDDSL